MASLWLLIISSTAGLLLRLAMVTIRFMQWLYNHGLISRGTTDRFFHAAKRLERRADRLTTRVKSTPLSLTPFRL